MIKQNKPKVTVAENKCDTSINWTVHVLAAAVSVNSEGASEGDSMREALADRWSKVNILVSLFLPCFPCVRSQGTGSSVGAHLWACAGAGEVCPARCWCTICHLTECNSGLSLHKETMRSAVVQRMRLLFVQGGHEAYGSKLNRVFVGGGGEHLQRYLLSEYW